MKNSELMGLGDNRMQELMYKINDLIGSVMNGMDGWNEYEWRSTCDEWINK